MPAARTVRVELGPASYDVVIAPGLLAELGPRALAAAAARRAVVITDCVVGRLYGQSAGDSLRSAGLDVSVIQYEAGEANKTLATLGLLYDRLFALRPRVDRDTLVVALGGGVVGDMAGLLAATALRGLRWLQCPTTLLAAVDASAGGKTGIDHPAGKNLIGAFHQPRGVLVDVRTLRTLPACELRSGLAECVKHAMIRDASLLAFIGERADAIGACDESAMSELVARNVAIKAAVVAADEREAGERAHLNFGHTVGHAIEAIGGYGSMTHGEAVGLGMLVACELARLRGMSADAADALRNTMARLGLPLTRGGLDAAALWEIMQHDKKARGGAVRMVLPVAVGRVEIVADVRADEVRQALRAIEP
jgi:3-dehydroquinate synthase